MKQLHVQLFPQSLQELNREIINWPDLQLQLRPDQELGERLGTVAAYLGIPLDAYYTPEAMDKLAEFLVMRLRQKRAIILSSSTH